LTADILPGSFVHTMTDDSIINVDLQVGDTAPDFTAVLQTPDSAEEINLYSVLESGKKVLLVFYPGDDTPGCTKQLCGIRDVYSEYEKKGVQVIGVNHASEGSHLKFINKYNYQFGIVVDEGHVIRELYGAKKKFFKNFTTKRGVFLIDTDKTILYRFWGQQDNQAILDLLG
jgi:peroxiredoxin Q/BCP